MELNRHVTTSNRRPRSNVRRSPSCSGTPGTRLRARASIAGLPSTPSTSSKWSRRNRRCPPVPHAASSNDRAPGRRSRTSSATRAASPA
jgi:hypothetical protein